MKENIEEKWKEKKLNKNRFKTNLLFLFVTSS